MMFFVVENSDNGAWTNDFLKEMLKFQRFGNRLKSW